MNSDKSFRFLLTLLSTSMIIHILAPPASCRRLRSTHDKINAEDEHKEPNQEVQHRRGKRSASTAPSGSTSRPRHDSVNGDISSHGNGFRLSQRNSAAPPNYPICDWCFSVNYNPNRTPQEIEEARCCSSRHQLSNDTIQIPILMNKPCETIYYHILVSMKSKQLDSELRIQETEKRQYYRAAVGCTPANPLVHRPSTS